MTKVQVQPLNKRQAAIVGLYTGVSCGPFGDIHELAEEVMGHPIWTHEFANEKFMENLQSKAKPMFLAICRQEKSGGEK